MHCCHPGLHSQHHHPYADERVFELPVGFSERLHARIDLELQGTGGG
jgi:hypothetical protein